MIILGLMIITEEFKVYYGPLGSLLFTRWQVRKAY